MFSALITVPSGLNPSAITLSHVFVPAGPNARRRAITCARVALAARESAVLAALAASRTPEED